MSRSKQYRADGPHAVSVIVEEHGVRHVRPLPHVHLHSPTGFSWGYGGSGPADLALSLLVDLLGEAEKIPASAYVRYDSRAVERIGRTRAWRLHQRFKRAVVANLPRDHRWTLDANYLLAVVSSLEERADDE